MNKTLPTAKKTKKKFYNKYIYKASLHIKGSGALRYYEFPKIVELLQLPARPHSNDSEWKEKLLNDLFDNQGTWFDLISFVNSHDESTWSKRLEGDTIDFYTNDRSFYNSIVNKFSQFVVRRFEPGQGMESTLLNATKEIFVDKLPYDMYNYRAYLKPHRLKLSREDRAKLARWMERQRPKITFTDSIRNWLVGNRHDWDRRYIHVDNDQTLLMLKLRSPELVGSVFKYVKTDK